MSVSSIKLQIEDRKADARPSALVLRKGITLVPKALGDKVEKLGVFFSHHTLKCLEICLSDNRFNSCL